MHRTPGRTHGCGKFAARTALLPILCLSILTLARDARCESATGQPFAIPAGSSIYKVISSSVILTSSKDNNFADAAYFKQHSKILKVPLFPQNSLPQDSSIYYSDNYLGVYVNYSSKSADEESAGVSLLSIFDNYGKLLWKTSLPRFVGVIFNDQTNKFVLADPISGDVSAYDMSGKLIQRKALFESLADEGDSESPAARYRLVSSFDNRIACISRFPIVRSNLPQSYELACFSNDGNVLFSNKIEGWKGNVIFASSKQDMVIVFEHVPNASPAADHKISVFDLTGQLLKSEFESPIPFQNAFLNDGFYVSQSSVTLNIASNDRVSK